ncbi:hypothetical protein BDQ17DRAFT_1390559 [Cyathus striatus]|nr:hypothetical protein BDQ17DRAFT_1390559 [Cyathus striatus]
MAENQHPLDSAQLPPRINLAALSKSKTRTRPTPTPSPMTSGRIYNVDTQVDPARMQLISPPPEETLRRVSRSTPFTPSLLASPTSNSTSKRKRSQQLVATAPPSSPTAKDSSHIPEATPNPKPRKQSKRHARTHSIESPTRPTPPHHAIIVKSPHANKPDADYIPPIPLSLLADAPSRRATISARSRRSATPIPPYEPPKDVFTPPREIFVTPTISESSKRKSTTKATSTVGKSKTKRKALKIKLEMPDIDLDAPMPPASPSDDPILLSGSVEPSSPIKPREPARVDAGVATSSPADDELNNVSRTHVFNWNQHNEPEGSTDFSSMDLDPADADVPRLPLFDLNDLPPSSDGGWSDSDDEAPPGPGNPDWDGIEGVGEYTGKWRMMKEWGRPISPFPKRIARLELVGEEDEGDHVQQEKTLEDILTGDHDKEMEDEERREEEEVRRMSVEPEEGVSLEEDTQRDAQQVQDARCYGQDTVDTTPSPAKKTDEVNPVEPQAVLDVPQEQHSFEDTSHLQGESEDEQEELEVRQMSVEREPEEGLEEYRNSLLASTTTIVQEERHVSPETGPSAASPRVGSHEKQLLREPSSPINAQERVSSQPASARYEDTFVSLQDRLTIDEDTPMENALDNDDDDDDASDSSDSEEIGLVKITSADPRAAARAVAILKQVITKRRHAETKRRRGSHSAVDDIAKEFRRKNIQGVSKELHSEKKRRRSTLGMSIIGDRVLIPGSPAITIPDLLKEAEAEVEVVTAQTPGIWAKRAEIEPQCDPFKTPLPLSKVLPSSLSDHEAGERGWAKEEWKLLDGCFTDERLEVGHRLDLGDENGLAPVDIVHIENVVQRFIDTIGGDSILSLNGDAWSRENLLQRAKALQNKQRAGHVAPPVTPYLPLPRSTEFPDARRMATIEVPEFTPLKRRPAPPRKHRPLLPGSYYYQQEESPMNPVNSEDHDDEEKDEIEETETILTSPERADSATDRNALPVPPPSIGKRVKGFFFSYLPTLSRVLPSNKLRKPAQPGLPLPPPDVLEKPRGPVATPIRPAAPKPIPPKELVQLHPAPAPPKPSMIPRVAKPRRLVELKPAPPPSPAPVPTPRPRRSSGGIMQARASLDAKPPLQRVKSIGDLRSGDKNRPTWKP